MSLQSSLNSTEFKGHALITSTVRSALSNISMSLTDYKCIFAQNAVAAHIHFGYGQFLCRFL